MLIDTNIFLEFFLGQNKAKVCKQFLEKVEKGEIGGFVTDFTLHSIGVILEKYTKKEFLSGIFISLNTFKGLKLLSANLEELSLISEFSVITGLDFDDAYQAYFCKKLNIPIVSYDSHFDGIIKRLKPEEVLQ